MKFTKAIVALFVGALIFTPATEAYAAQAPDLDSQQVETAPRTAETTQAETAQSEATPEADEAATQAAQLENEAPAAVAAVLKISGTAKVGKKLRVKATGVSADAVYTWYVGGKRAGTGKTYTIKAKDRTKRIQVKADGAKSSLTKKVTKQKAKVAVKKLKVTGSAKVGKKLKANAKVKKPSDLKLKGTYTWYVSGKKVKTGKTLKIKKKYANKTVRVTYSVKWKTGKYRSDSKKKSWKKKATWDRSSKAITKTARSATGIPYVWGASSRKGADCSGLVKYVYAQHGITLPNNDRAIAAKGKRVSKAKAKPGDVIHYPGHVAIYVGKGKMVEAQTVGTKSKVSSVRGGGTFYRMT